MSRRVATDAVMPADWLQERARVVALFAGGVWVEAEPGTGCEGCSAKGCGSALLMRRQRRRLPLYTETPLRVGEHVRLGVPASGFLTSALLVYGAPLLTAIVAGGVAEELASAGHYVVPLAFAGGLLAGCLISHDQLRRRWRRHRPILLAVEPESSR